jgi:excisionase family DNA binding protein
MRLKKARKRPRTRTAKDENFLTPTETAKRLLVAPVTVRLWASKGLLPSVATLGGHRRFRASDIEKFVARQRRKAPAATRPKLLIIDDDAQYARYLARVLAKATPLDISFAADGFTAGLLCESLKPGLVTLDLHMPDLDGFEVCAQLRQRYGRERMRIVALTGFASPKNARRILKAGADACLSKDASTTDILRELGLSDAAAR